MQETWKREASLGELFQDLAADARLLVRQEVQLAKAELKQGATRMSRAAIYLALGALLGGAALLSFVAALIALLSTFMSVWFAAFIVGVLTAAIAYIVVNKGLVIIKATQMA